MKPRAIDLGGVPLPPSLVGVKILLDRSGSMRSIRGAMVSAFADFVDEQKSLDPESLWLSLDQFDDDGYDVCFARQPIAEVGRLDLHPRGNTPLADAIMRFGTDAKAIIDDPADPTDRLLLVIITDGGENASKTYTMAQAKALLDGLKADNCEVIYLGTEEAVDSALSHQLVAQGATVSFAASSQGVGYAYGGLRCATMSARVGESGAESVASYTQSGGAYSGAADAVDRLRTAASARTQKETA